MGPKCLTEKQLSRTRICPKTCNKMLSTVRLRHWKNTTLRRTSLLTSRRNSTKSTTQPGIASADETSDHTLPMKRSTSSTSIWDKWLCYCSNPDKFLFFNLENSLFHKAAFHS